MHGTRPVVGQGRLDPARRTTSHRRIRCLEAMVRSCKAQPRASAQWPMGIGHHWLGRYKDFFRELGKRPTTSERRARTSERHRLLVPTRVAVWVAVAVVAYFLIWPMLQSAFN